jgi:hypothetical protein
LPKDVPDVRPEFETFLARLYTDAQLRSRFLTDPRGEAERHQLTTDECSDLERIDRAGLELSARSFAHKRALNAAQRTRRSWLSRFAEAFRKRH